MFNVQIMRVRPKPITVGRIAPGKFISTGGNGLLLHCEVRTKKKKMFLLSSVHTIRRILAKARATACSASFGAVYVRRTLSNGSFAFDRRTVHQKNFINNVDEICSDLVANERSVRFGVRYDT